MAETTEAKPGALPSNRLEADAVLASLERLERRIRERFPTRTLGLTCRDLIETARGTARRVERVCKPFVLLRLAIALVVLGVAAAVWFLAASLWPTVAGMVSEASVADYSAATQAFESAVNLMLLAAVAIYSLALLETRLRRRAVLRHLFELRRYAHVIDMHQLDKDPVAIANPSERTASSPVRDMSLYDLARYLNYCSEMLSLIGKLAALYSENVEDPEIIEAASDIETLTTNLGRKTWQKITMIQAHPREDATAPGVGAAPA